ncbi:SDR family oxidoreductase [Actinomadura bangladeshensis]|uniref:SDR family oxidoreductase n=1 Tax=Actinomadura bangladeshensis TaxID=453573 RepID=A0A4R4PDR4_9ACTN|nr:SDR family oxidoreductase [Actinomadura bangladeshensis]TDC20354.1 SDR family oxidoreductase [Actinomadura bangladeshensis]
MSTGTVLVTGALGGMGEASCRRLATRYPHLLLTDRDEGRLATAAQQVRELGARCDVVGGDLAEPAAITRIGEFVGEHGGLRALVHTAAVSPSMADWKTLLTVDLLGTIRLLDTVFPHTGPGSVAVCFASIAAHMGRPVPGPVAAELAGPLDETVVERIAAAAGTEPSTGTAYIWAKSAVVTLCERLAGSWGRRGARIVSLSPGLIDTPMGRLELAENEQKKTQLEVTPLRGDAAGRRSDLPGRTDDIAAAVDFLCSADASFLNGIDLRLDGGFIGVWRHELGRDHRVRPAVG